MKEYLATLDDTAWGAASDVVPKFVSPSDPAAQWTGAHKGPAFFAYSDNYLIDVKFGVIVDVVRNVFARIAERIVQEIGKMGNGIGCSVSIKTCGVDGLALETAIHDVDKAMYAEKKRGKNHSATQGRPRLVAVS